MTQTVPLKFTILGLNELKAADKTMQGWAKPSGPLPKATKNTAKFGTVAQNAGYQVSDFIVSVQGGMDPLRSLGQQLPQLTIGMGAWGAALGVAAAALPSIIQLMSDTEAEVVPLTDALDALTDSTASLNSTVTTINFSDWNEQWNNAGESVRGAMLQLLRFRQAVAQGALQDAANALNEELGQVATTFQMVQGFLFSVITGVEGVENNLRDIELQKKLGVDRATVDQIQALAIQMKTGAISIEEFSNAMVDLGINQQSISPVLAEYIRQIQEMALAEKNLAEGRKQLDAASAAAGGAGGGILPTDGKGGKGAPLSQELHDFARSVAETQRDAIEGTRKMREEYTLTQEAALAGSRMLETSLDAVVRGTQDAKTAFKQLAVSIIADIARIAATRAAFNFLGITPNADGNVIQNGKVQPFAKGGVVSSPTFFPMAGGGAGVMGEAGPEAILPLGRTGTGELGVKSAPMNVTINNNAPGVAVQTSQSESGLSVDIVLEGVASAIRRGGNDISNSLEDTFALSRGQSAY